MLRHLHFVVPEEIYEAWLKYVDEVKVNQPSYNATITFCALPEITKNLDNPFMLLRRAKNRKSGSLPKFIKVK